MSAHRRQKRPSNSLDRESWILDVTRADSDGDVSLLVDEQPFDYRLAVPEPPSPKKASSLSAINAEHNDSDDDFRAKVKRQSSSFRAPKVARASMLGEIVHHVPSPDAEDSKVKAKEKAEAQVARQTSDVVPGAFAIQSKAPSPKADTCTLPISVAAASSAASNTPSRAANSAASSNPSYRQTNRGSSQMASAVEDALLDKEKEKERSAATAGNARRRSSAHKTSAKHVESALASMSSPGAFRHAAEAGVSPIKQKMLRELVFPSTASPRIFEEGESPAISSGRSTIKEKMIQEHGRQFAATSPGAFQATTETPKSPLENKMMRHLVYPSLEKIDPQLSPGGSSLKQKMLREHLPPATDLVQGEMDLPLAQVDAPCKEEPGNDEADDAVVAAYLAPSEVPRTVTTKLKRTVSPDSPAHTAPASNTRMVADESSSGHDPENGSGGEVLQAVTLRSVKQSSARKKHMVRIAMVVVVVVALSLGFILSSKIPKRDKGGSSQSAPGTGDGSPPSSGPPGSPGQIPSFAPTSTRFQLIKEEVMNQFPSMTIEHGGASYEAVDWLANDDLYHFEYPLSQLGPAEQLHFRQRFALATFFFSTGGRLGGYPAGTWKDPCNFMSSRHVCQWQCLLPPQLTPSLYALTKTTLMGVQCGQDFGIDSAFDDHVISVELVQNGLTGKIPKEIEGLESLFFLNLFENTIQGSIPFENLAKSLVNLILPVNNIQGSIAAESLQEFKKLRTLWLDWNQLTGTLPTNMAADLPLLTVASFGNNLLEGPIPRSFFQIEGIETVVLSNNMLTGTLPEISLSKINSLDVQGNFIEGTIPQSVSSLAGAYLFSFIDNQISGTIPTQMASLTNLQFLGLSGNLMTGDPTSQDFLWELSNLNSLFLGSNEFTGSLHSGIGKLSKLQKFGIESNAIVGTLPPVIGNLTELELLTLSYNQFTGTIPTEFAQLTKLDILSIEMNKLTGDLQPFCDASRTNGLFQADCSKDGVVCTCCSICCDSLGICVAPSLN